MREDVVSRIETQIGTLWLHRTTSRICVANINVVFDTIEEFNVDSKAEYTA